MPKADQVPRLLKTIQSEMKKERWRGAISLLKENSSLVDHHWELLLEFRLVQLQTRTIQPSGKTSHESSADCSREAELHVPVWIGDGLSQEEAI
jgi:hypothetical protein